MNFSTKADKLISKHPYLASFLISLLILLLYSIIQGIYPFGGETFLRKDLYHQYYPFLCELRRRLLNGESLRFSFDLGIGSSFYAMYVYYLSDPLNLLSVIVPERLLLEFLTCITYFKIALASSFMCRYLTYRSKKTDPLILVVFSLCYGFSGYIASYDWNVMWMWGIALAPLVLMGFEKMLKGEGSFLYLVSFAFTVWTNYYIAMLEGIFLVIYFIILSIEENRGATALIKGGIRAFFSTLIAGGISGVLLIPEYAVIKGTSFISGHFPDELRFYLSLPELMLRSLMAVEVETGLGHEPALYISLITLVLIPLFFMNGNIPLKIRLSRGFLLVFFYFSFNTNLLEYIWHGFNYPDSIPARQACFFTIMALCCAVMALDGIKETGRLRLFTASLVPGLFYAVCIIFCRNEAHTDAITWIINACFILIYLFFCMMFIFRGGFASRPLIYAFSAVLVFELMINLNLTSLRDISRKSYFRHIHSYSALAGEAEKRNRLNQGLFTRFDTLDENIRNYSSLTGYHDVSYFSSTIDKEITGAYKQSGMKSSRVHYMGEGLTPFMSAVMGIDYVLANEYRNNQTDFDIAEFIYEKDDDYLFRNRFSLPFGYSIPSGSYDLDGSEDNAFDPIDLQNIMAVKLGGDEIFSKIHGSYLDNAPGRTIITIPEEGHYYAWTDADIKEVKEYTDFSDEAYGEFEDMKYDSIMDLGRLDEGCEVRLEADNDEKMYISLYRFEADSMIRLMDDLMKETLTLTEFDEDHIEGIAEISEGRELLLALPSSEGWEIWLDGKDRIEPGTFYGLFMKLSVPPGIHHISLTYHIPYLGTGILVSAVSLAAAVLWFFLCNKRLYLDQQQVIE